MISGTSVRAVLLAFIVFAIGRETARADQLTAATIQVVFSAPIGTSASVDITASSPEQHWTRPVSAGHTATTIGLPPGTYTVSVSVTNGQHASTTVMLTAGIVTRFAARVERASDTPAIVLIDRRQVGQGAVFDATFLRDFPAGNSLAALADTAAPFVMADRFDTGGLVTAAFSRVGTRGASWTSARLSLDGLDAGAPTSAGAFAFYPDLHAFESVAITSGMLPPDVGTAGVNIALTPRRPGDAVHASLDASFTGPRWVSDGSSKFGAPPIAALDHWADVNVQASAPVTKRIGAFVSLTRTQIGLTERGQATVQNASVSSAFAHVVARPSARDEVRVIGAAQRLSHGFDGRRQFADTDVEQRDTLSQAQLSWDHQSRHGSQTSVIVGVHHSALTPDVAATAAGGAVDRVFDGLIPVPARATTLNRASARIEFSPAVAPGLGHVRAVLTLARSSVASSLLALPSVAELVGGLPARVWTPTDPGVDSARSLTEMGLALGTSLAVAPNATVDLGIRADVASGSAQAAVRGIGWTTLAPRASFRWVALPFIVYGGVSRYHSPPSLDLLAFGDPGEPVINVRRWQDTNGNKRFDDGEAGTLVAVAGRNPSIASIDPSLDAPTTDEFTLGLERELSRALFVRATAVVRRNRSIPRSVEIGTTAANYDVINVPDGNTSIAVGEGVVGVYNRRPASFGQDRYLLSNVTDDTSSYDGLEIAGGLRTVRWYSTAGVSAYRAKGLGGNRGFRADENDPGVIGELFEDPNATVNSTGRLFFDRAYVLKWSTAFHTARDFLTAVTARYQDGQPFSRLVLVPGLSQGPEAVSADRLGSTRFTFNVTVDARVEKGFMFGRKHGAIRLDVFNLLNHGNEVEEDPIAGLGFRRTTAAQPPRAVRVGRSFEY